jgi:plasmid maintenance system killer protein
MMVVRFRNDSIRRACCDLAWMHRRWGPDTARSVSRRLQQLEAMETLADLAFLPFDHHKHDNGLIEVAITDQIALVIEQDPATQPGAPMNTITVTVTGIRDRAAMARTS